MRGIHQSLSPVGARRLFLSVVFALLVLFPAHAQDQATHAVQRVPLTADEQAFVARSEPVTVCVDPDWEPFERLTESGEHVGIAGDLLRLVVSRVGLRLNILPVSSWEESIRASKDGRCQIMSFLNPTDERKRWLRFTSTLFQDANVLITREEHPFVVDVRNLTNEKVALPRQTMVEERVRHDFPNLEVIPTESEAEAIEMVSTRQADMTIRSLIVAAYTIKREGLFNLKISGQIPEYTNALAIGVLKDQVLLHQVLDKGVRSVTAADREAIVNRHVSIQVQGVVDYSLAWKVMGGAALVIAALLAWVRKQRELERTRLQLAQQRVREEQRARMEQSRLVAMLSHEVKTPLAIIDGAAQSLKLLMESGDQELLRRVDRIRQGVRRLDGLTTQFLAKDRLDDEAIALRPQITDCQGVVTSLQDGLDDGGRLQVEVDGDTHIHADPVLLDVALRNLVTNALRYSPAESPVQVRLTGRRDTVTITVTDRGPGLAPEVRDNLFTSYLRGANVKDKPGAGLGLYLVKRVVDLHGGSISVHCETGVGTTFSLSFPRSGHPELAPQGSRGAQEFVPR
ncbi:MAG: transporter substrate-binding domain-containing protein [Hydrogenophaga sp.]|nr:transporter substrate-binding domain-containing protein [Hydrogenophaga sp.]